MKNRNIKLFEEFEENEFDLSPDKISFMDNLYQKLKTIIKPIIPEQFDIKYKRGDSITIKTDNNKDLIIKIKIVNRKINYYSKTTSGLEFELEYDFNEKGYQTIIKSIKKEFDIDPNNGLHRKYSNDDDTYQFDTDEPSSNLKEEDMDLKKPIKKKPIRRKRSININIIKNVLEDAYIMDDIDLKETSVEELIRRMLLESIK